MLCRRRAALLSPAAVTVAYYYFQKHSILVEQSWLLRADATIITRETKKEKHCVVREQLVEVSNPVINRNKTEK
jgi:hypothetical protein